MLIPHPRCALAALLTLALLAPPAHAQFAVYDAANWLQNAAQVARSVVQIRHQLSQLETMYQNLLHFDDPSWRDLRGYMALLDELADQGKSLGYVEEGLFGHYREVLPGFVPMEPEGYEDVYREWTEIALDTLAATLDSASAQARTHVSTQEQLAELQDFANRAEGNRQSLHASNMLQGHMAQEIAKLNQLLSAHLNAQNVYTGLILNLQAGQEATQREMVEASREPFHVYTGEDAFTGIPRNWPFACYGCGGGVN